MPKLLPRLIAGAIMLPVACASAPAAVLGPHGGDCASPARPAMLVKVEGLKTRTGALRVQSYGGDPQHFFDKHTYLERIDLRTPAAGPIEVCVPVARNGAYAISVRHDVNGTGKTDMTDGMGVSGNPNISLLDVVFRRKPSPGQVTVAVHGLTPVPVVLNYVHGMSVGPIVAVGR